MPQSPTQRRFDLVVCDIDGCLSSEGTDALDLESLAIVAEHNRAAARVGDRPIVTPCSGRPQPFVEAMCRLIANSAVPAVCENGVWLYDAGSNEYMMDPSIDESHLDAVRQAESWVRADLAPDGASIQPGKAASVSLYHPDPERLRGEIRRRVEDQVERRGWPFRVSMTWFYINCDLKHISKATALDRLLARTGTPRERIAGIGDTPSDMAIRERVGFFACPANAHDEIKAEADFVADKPEAAGVVQILGALTSV